MIQYAGQPQKSVYQKQYRAFRGVDLSSGVTEVDPSRSPHAPNMISDQAGFPEKRPGYRSIFQVGANWCAAGETWTYASATVFTVAGDRTARYRAGYAVRFDQGGTTKTGVIASCAYAGGTTAVTLTMPALTSAAVTNGYYKNNLTVDSGWVSCLEEEWIFAGGDAFAVAGDKTAKYQEGYQVKLDQDGAAAVSAVSSAVYSAESGLTTVKLVQNVVQNLPITNTWCRNSLLTALGWIAAGETWIYAGADSFTVSGDKRSKYPTSTLVKFDQDGIAKAAKVGLSAYDGSKTTVTLTKRILDNTEIVNAYYSYDTAVYGIFSFVRGDGSPMLVAHVGTKLYSLPVLEVVLPESITDITPAGILMNRARSTSFVMRSSDKAIGYKLCLYILDGVNYLRYDGYAAAAPVETAAYIPTTTISSPPAGGGEKYESVNLLQPKRINRFLGSAADKDYYLDAYPVDSISLVEKLNSSTGNWDTVSAGSYSLTYDSKGCARVTFTAAPGAAVGGIDNIRVTFTKAVEGYADRIRNCTIAAFYGIGSDNRIFLSGNPQYRNYDWQSGIANPEYFPDDGYAVVGSENSAIMGYLKEFDSLVVVKEDNDQDASLYLRTSTISSDGAKITYPLKQGFVGVGAISKYSFGVLEDDPLFFSRQGVFGIESSTITSQRTVQMRSYYVNGSLLKEPALNTACAAIWNGWYCLFVNGHAYVANSRQMSSNKTGSQGYEWFYWEDIPASCCREFKDNLYFGTALGDICRFTPYAEYGMSAYWDAGSPYVCQWSTKMDDLGDFMRMKTILKRGVGIIAKPYVLSSGTVYFANEDISQGAASTFGQNLVTFDFGIFDFSKISFNPVNNPRVTPINHKLKDLRLLQVIVESAAGGTGFGIYGIQIRYVFTKDVKK